MKIFDTSIQHGKSKARFVWQHRHPDAAHNNLTVPQENHSTKEHANEALRQYGIRQSEKLRAFIDDAPAQELKKENGYTSRIRVVEGVRYILKYKPTKNTNGETYGHTFRYITEHNKIKPIISCSEEADIHIDRNGKVVAAVGNVKKAMKSTADINRALQTVYGNFIQDSTNNKDANDEVTAAYKELIDHGTFDISGLSVDLTAQEARLTYKYAKHRFQEFNHTIRALKPEDIQKITVNKALEAVGVDNYRVMLECEQNFDYFVYQAHGSGLLSQVTNMTRYGDDNSETQSRDGDEERQLTIQRDETVRTQHIKNTQQIIGNVHKHTQDVVAQGELTTPMEVKQWFDAAEAYIQNIIGENKP